MLPYWAAVLLGTRQERPGEKPLKRVLPGGTEPVHREKADLGTAVMTDAKPADSEFLAPGPTSPRFSITRFEGVRNGWCLDCPHQAVGDGVTARGPPFSVLGWVGLRGWARDTGFRASGAEGRPRAPDPHVLSRLVGVSGQDQRVSGGPGIQQKEGCSQISYLMGLHFQHPSRRDRLGKGRPNFLEH